MIKILALLLCLTISSPALAIYAPRAMAMGEAFTAIADDTYAAYYNPAGFALNPGIDMVGSYQINNRNQAVGDNTFALKACFELGINPFEWVLGVGAATYFAYETAKYLHDEGVVKKGWGREGETTAKDESMAESVKEEDEKQEAAGQEPKRDSVSKKALIKKAAKEVGKAAIKVTGKLADAALKEVALQSRHYYYAPYWYRPNYYRPNYWDNRYDYSEKELTPAGKAQFGGGITVMMDKNSSAAIDQNTNWYSFSVASGYAETVALGANLNIYDLTVVSTDVKGLGGGLDVGGLIRISDKLMFGICAKELLTTDITWTNGAVTRYQMNVNTGVGIRPFRQLLIAADIHNAFAQNGEEATMHYGVEFMPAYGLAVRAGLSDNSKTAGMSVGVGNTIIDYALLGGTYNRTHLISLSWKL
ncbi:MAG: hypothetical protein ABIE84_02245 [bacterium]